MYDLVMIDFDPTLIHDWLVRSASRTPNKEAIVCGQDRLTYRELDVRSDRFAEALLDHRDALEIEFGFAFELVGPV